MIKVKVQNYVINAHAQNPNMGNDGKKPSGHNFLDSKSELFGLNPKLWQPCIYALWTPKVRNNCAHICAMDLKELSKYRRSSMTSRRYMFIIGLSIL